MRINEDKVRERLSDVDKKNRVYIWNAEIIIEFLNETFMPTDFFLEGNAKSPLEKKDFADGALEKCQMKAWDMYEMYQQFREIKPYTAEIETRWKFMAITNKLMYDKNRWEFIKYRKTAEQVPYYAPVLKRTEVSAKIRDQYPTDDPDMRNVEAAQIEITEEDKKENQTEEERQKEKEIREPEEQDLSEIPDEGPFKEF